MVILHLNPKLRLLCEITLRGRAISAGESRARIFYETKSHETAQLQSHHLAQPIPTAPGRPTGTARSQSTPQIARISSPRARARTYYVRTFLDVLAGGALAEDLRESPVQRLRRLALVAGARGIHGARPSVRHAIAPRGHRIGGAADRGGEEKVLE